MSSRSFATYFFLISRRRYIFDGLPVQLLLALQSFLCFFLPSQPDLCGDEFVQVLSRVVNPEPHVTEQLAHSPQSDQPLCSEKSSNFFLNLIFNKKSIF